MPPMASRADDWLRQARRDLEHARETLEHGTFEWAAFAAQQAAEKAVKALYQHLGAEARGHSVTQLLGGLPANVGPSDDLIETAKELDRHYITPRYPNSYPEGAPMDFYTRGEAQRAYDGAKRVVDYCQDHLLRS
jgi:HEPN domain-containing protein